MRAVATLTFFVFRKASHFSFSVLRPGKTLESLSLMPEWRRYRSTADARGELRRRGVRGRRGRPQTQRRERWGELTTRGKQTKKRCWERIAPITLTGVVKWNALPDKAIILPSVLFVLWSAAEDKEKHKKKVVNSLHKKKTFKEISSLNPWS